MIIERNIKAKKYRLLDLERGTVVSILGFPEVYLLTDHTVQSCVVFSLERNVSEEWHPDTEVIIRKAKLVLEE